jgi:hypothetical protein
MLHDRTPKRPRERDDDPDLHVLARKIWNPRARTPDREIPEGGCLAAASFDNMCRKAADPRVQISDREIPEGVCFAAASLENIAASLVLSS